MAAVLSGVAQDPARLRHLVEDQCEGIDERLFLPPKRDDAGVTTAGELWKRWLTSSCGGGISACPRSISTGELHWAIDSFWRWRQAEATHDDPFLDYARREDRTLDNRREGRAGVGYRRSLEAPAAQTMRLVERALRLWCSEHGHDHHIVDLVVGRHGMSVRTQAPREQFLVADDQLADMVAVLWDQKVPVKCKGVRREAWHARQLAALCVQITGVLRSSELVQLEDTATTLHDDRSVIELTSTKTGARRVILGVRNDLACPIRALAWWLGVADEAGYDRQGRLLPRLLQRPPHPGMAPVSTKPGRAAELRALRLVMDAAGIPVTELRDDPTLMVGTHGLRSALPARASAAGASATAIARLGGGAWADGSEHILRYVGGHIRWHVSGAVQHSLGATAGAA